MREADPVAQYVHLDILNNRPATNPTESVAVRGTSRVKLKLLCAVAALATSVSSAPAQEGDAYETWYDGDSGLPFRVYRDKPGSDHWQG